MDTQTYKEDAPMGGNHYFRGIWYVHGLLHVYEHVYPNSLKYFIAPRKLLLPLSAAQHQRANPRRRSFDWRVFRVDSSQVIFQRGFLFGVTLIDNNNAAALLLSTQNYELLLILPYVFANLTTGFFRFHTIQITTGTLRFNHGKLLSGCLLLLLFTKLLLLFCFCLNLFPN